MSYDDWEAYWEWEYWSQFRNDPDDNSYDDSKAETHKKKNTIVLIDAESVDASHCSGIVGQCKSIGEVAEMRYYARQKDASTRAWIDVAKKYGIKSILMSGNPEPNKIDNKLKKDAKKILKENRSIDIFCIASRDGDYTDLVRFLREQKKRVVILATKDTSQKLKGSASEVKGI